MERLYIFPRHFVICSPVDFFSEPWNRPTDEKVVFDTKERITYLCREKAVSFLELMRSPHSRQELVRLYGESVDTLIDRLTIQGILVPLENCLTDFLPAKQPDSALKIKEFGQYTFIEKLNSNKNIAVLHVMNEQGEEFTLKYLESNIPERFADSFHREFETMIRLGAHPCLVDLIEYDREKNFAVMKYIKGCDVSRYVKTNVFPVEDRIELVRQILEVISFLHQSGVVHGDIHAKQFLIDHNNRLKLIDFGYSFHLNERDELQHIMIGGVHKYIEPEHLTGNIFNKFTRYQPDMGCDLYRLSILIYYIFYNQFPYEGFTWKEFHHRSTFSSALSLNETATGEKVPAQFKNFFCKAFQKNPDDRFKSADEMMRFLFL